MSFSIKGIDSNLVNAIEDKSNELSQAQIDFDNIDQELNLAMQNGEDANTIGGLFIKKTSQSQVLAQLESELAELKGKMPIKINLDSIGEDDEDWENRGLKHEKKISKIFKSIITESMKLLNASHELNLDVDELIDWSFKTLRNHQYTPKKRLAEFKYVKDLESATSTELQIAKDNMQSDMDTIQSITRLYLKEIANCR